MLSFEEFFERIDFQHLASYRFADPLETVILSLLIITYFTTNYYLLNGRTIGKLTCNLRVVDPLSYELSLEAAFSRSLGYLFSMLCFNLPFLLNFLHRGASGVPDWISATRVVDERLYREFISPSNILRLEFTPDVQPPPIPDFGKEQIESPAA